MKTTTRPHNLDAKLPDPPAPPEGHRWIYSGYNFHSAAEKHRAWLTDDGIWIVAPKATATWNPTHYLEAVPDSPQEFSQQDLATSLTHLKTLLNEYGAGCFGDIREFVARFDPPFDWISFWDSLPAWHNYVAQDDWSGAWYSFEVKPHKGKDSWHSLECLEIPTEYCPPATDWESSLVVRPGYAEK